MGKTRDLTQGNIKKTIVQMVLPMILGMFGMVAFNFADTAFVAQLGGIELAAMSFTFPVIMIVQAIAVGLGIGTGSVVSRAAGDRNSVKRLTTDSLLLSVIIVIIAAAAGIATIRPLFAGIGAGDDVMPYITQYMTIWYLGLPMVVIPMVGNNIIRALGDTKIPGLVMLFSALLNIILDPLFIFGLGPIPKMGISGAALTTVVSRFISLVVALYILGKREKLLKLSGATLKMVMQSFKRILHVGIPSALVKAIVPFGAYIITGLLAVYGNDTVAGYGAGVKTEFVTFCVINAMSAVAISFLGQNYGQHRHDRIKQGFRYMLLLNIVYSVAIYIILFFIAPYVAMLFSDKAAIQQTTVLYIRIAVAALAFQGGVQITTSAFNAVGKPLYAAMISLLQMFVIYIPLSYLLGPMLGEAGIFLALSVSYVVASAAGYAGFMRFLRRDSADSLDKQNV